VRSSSSGRLYRIVSFDRAVQLFEREELHFAHPSSWADPYEVRLQHAASHQLFGQCWCTRGVSDAMWRIYSTTHLGVRISTSTKKLREALTPRVKALGFALRMDQVNYESQHNINAEIRAIRDDLKDNFTTDRAMDALFIKRDAFDHEAEYRAVICNPKGTEDDVRKGVKVQVNPHRLVDSILLDPRAPRELAEAFTYYFKAKIGFKRRVAPSVLYKSQVPIVVEPDDA
jgi:hypothetical protein